MAQRDDDPDSGKEEDSILSRIEEQQQAQEDDKDWGIPLVSQRDGGSGGRSVLNRFRGEEHARDDEQWEVPEGTPATVATQAVDPQSIDTKDKTFTERFADFSASIVEFFSETDEGPSAIDRFAYQKFGGWFRDHENHPRIRRYRKTVNQARLDETYDEYLSRLAFWSLTVSIFGAIIGLLIGLSLHYAGILQGIESNTRFPEAVHPLLPFVQTLKIPFAISTLVVGIGSIFGSLVAVGYYYVPKNRAYNRQREIDYLLPQAITYMYALSQGDMVFPDIVSRVADETETYGEIAREFQAIVNDTQFFGADLRGALRETREATPSDELGELLDDMTGIIDSGGGVAPFLHDKTEDYQRRAHKRSKHYIDNLELIAEMYVSVAVVGVMLGIVVFVIMNSVNGGGGYALYGLIYIGIPSLSIMFILLADSLSADEKGTSAGIANSIESVEITDIEKRLSGDVDADHSPENNSVNDGVVADGGLPALSRTYSRISGHTNELSSIEQAGLKQLYTSLRREKVLETLRAPLRLIKEDPIFSLVATIPAAMLYIAVVVLSGFASLSIEAFTTIPVWTTTLLIVIPVLGIMTPLSYFHEKERRYQNRINKELPAVLKKLAQASSVGANLQEAISIVAESSDDYLSVEFGRVGNELEWNVSMDDALVRMANRVENPRLARVLKLLIEANTASGRVREVLTVAAQDTQNAYEIDKDQFDAMTSYMVITMFGFILFLAVSAILLVKLFPPLADAAQATSSGGSQQASPFSDSIDIATYRMIFFHGALLQAAGSGFVAGKLGYGDVLSGTKFAIGAFIVTTITFFVI